MNPTVCFFSFERQVVKNIIVCISQQYESRQSYRDENQWHVPHTLSSEILRALAIIIAIFLWFVCHFLSSYAFFKKIYKI